MWSRGFGEKGKQVNVGCLMQTDQTVVAGFSVGELLDDGTICITSHKWDISAQAWAEHSVCNRRFQKLYEVKEQPSTFSSFGDSEKSGCGMLDSTFDKMEEIGCKTISHFNTALELLNDAIQKVDIK